MESKVIEKELGPEAKLKVEYVDGKVRVEVVHKGKIGGAGAYVEVDAYELVDAITDAIPGEMDDTFIDPIAQKMLAKKKA